MSHVLSHFEQKLNSFLKKMASRAPQEMFKWKPYNKIHPQGIRQFYDNYRLAPNWQNFGTITCDGLHGIMNLYIDKPYI